METIIARLIQSLALAAGGGDGFGDGRRTIPDTGSSARESGRAVDA